MPKPVESIIINFAAAGNGKLALAAKDFFALIFRREEQEFIVFMTDKMKRFLKEEAVFCIAALLAAGSCIAVPPSKAYLEYIDFKVLALLFCLMLVVAGLRSAGVFERLMDWVLSIAGNTRRLTIILVMTCFLLSMWITNDVALITFVPFSIMVFQGAGFVKYLPFTVVMETIAANLGSMCTPIGNPQNLYLYMASGMSIGRFLALLLPYTLISLGLTAAACMTVKKEVLTTKAAQSRAQQSTPKRVLIYAILFVICMLTVLRAVHYLIMLAVVAAVVAAVESKLFGEADYMLLLTFVAFFVLVGNIRQMPAVTEALSRWVTGNEILASVLSSQVISNVPAAVLLSGFTSDYEKLLIGTNIGGLGTMIASMASLISYKLLAKAAVCKKSRYLAMFTLMNLLFLAALLFVAGILKSMA